MPTGMTKNVRFTISVGDHYMGGLEVVMSKTNRIGDIEHNI